MAACRCRSYQRWQSRPGLSRPLFSAFDLVLAQNGSLAERFAQLGVARTLDVGNLKADAPPPPADLPGRRKLDAALAGRTVWLAASTHPGEDETVMAAHCQMKTTRPDLLTIIVPRHPERGPVIFEQLRAANFTGALRSEGQLPDAATDIYVADTIGELGLFYAIAPVAFVGGSLVPPWRAEPGRADQAWRRRAHRPALAEFRRAYEELLKRGRRQQVTDAPSLAAAALLCSKMRGAQAGMTGAPSAPSPPGRCAAAHAHASSSTILPPKATLQHAS